ncbi:hypothetical protein BY996DRAFT_6595290 [Phakopsora pachyrhizi]|nr:hypothetical protein BY996DRAFT_6595290 [Phakopsora pachyrhizi]
MPRLVQWDVRNFHSLSMNMYHTAITAYILEDMRTRGIIIDKINKTKAPATGPAEGIYEVICDYGANGWCTMSHGLCLYRLNAGAWNSGNNHHKKKGKKKRTFQSSTTIVKLSSKPLPNLNHPQLSNYPSKVLKNSIQANRAQWKSPGDLRHQQYNCFTAYFANETNSEIIYPQETIRYSCHRALLAVSRPFDEEFCPSTYIKKAEISNRQSVVYYRRSEGEKERIIILATRIGFNKPLTSVSDQLKRGGEDNWLQWRTIDTSIARIRANILSSQLSSPFTPRKTACTYDL